MFKFTLLALLLHGFRPEALARKAWFRQERHCLIPGEEPVLSKIAETLEKCALETLTYCGSFCCFLYQNDQCQVVKRSSTRECLFTDSSSSVGSQLLYYNYGNVTYRLISGEKPVTMSSLQNILYPGSQVTDGNLNTMGHTKSEDGPWARIDLLNIHVIHRVVFYNKPGASGERTENLHITVGNTDDELNDFINHLCWKVLGKFAGGEVVNENCRSLIPGRYVQVKIDTINYLNFMELEVYGCD